MFTQNHGLCPWDKKAAPISSPAAEESLPLMREVAFAEQMTEGEKGLKRYLSPSLAQALDSPLVRGGQ